ncbi:hypothetical protein AQ490_14660 [Wenjunlia vitaminophila]|uniref:DUF3179 domain-containing protein n=2 Tax=Wenjunlia vitaminophila TaxID=76728 RepID=A0A0T6LX52_WENVI|nr:hypothetical protein AQ490_14660 [Wenjunlia vitaminophila]
MLVLMYSLAVVALTIGTAAFYLALVPAFPVSWLYYHYFIRKPAAWTLLAAGVGIAVWETVDDGFPLSMIAPLSLLVLATWLTYWFHQDVQFPAVDYPEMAEDPLSLPLRGEMQLAVIEYGGVTKAYPLDYVIHHHIVNDRFGDKIVSLTYCAHCRSIMPFDVTDIGPLLVGSFKDTNMIVADRRTKTFFQQATFKSIIGKLHPHTLKLIHFQVLSWTDVRRLDPMPQVAKVTERDVKGMDFAVPGSYERLMSSNHTLGLPKNRRDNTFPPRTRVVGVLEPTMRPWSYLRNELLQQRVVKNEDGFYMVAVNSTINAFQGEVDGHEVKLAITEDLQLSDRATGTVWDLRGHRIRGELQSNLTPVALSDEYWFSWKLYHPDTKLIRF